MTEGHRLHETRIQGRGVDPADAFVIEPVDGSDGIAVIALKGELDMSAAPAVRARVDAAASGRALVLDLAEVTFVDSSTLKELLRAANELDRYETRFVLAAVPPPVQRLLELTRTTELFTTAPDRAAAVRLASS